MNPVSYREDKLMDEVMDKEAKLAQYGNQTGHPSSRVHGDGIFDKKHTLHHN